MITFLPYPNFAACSMVLDRTRLRTQISEAQQIRLAVRNGGGWRSHPAVIMWRDYELALCLYRDVMCREWVRRGYVAEYEQVLPPLDQIVLPGWLGNEAIHSSHRGMLLFRDAPHYTQFGWTDTVRNEYVWPSA